MHDLKHKNRPISDLVVHDLETRGVAEDGLDPGESVKHLSYWDGLRRAELVLGLEPLAGQAGLHVLRCEKWEQRVHGVLKETH